MCLNKCHSHFRSTIQMQIDMFVYRYRYKKKWWTIRVQRTCLVNNGIRGIRCCYQVSLFFFLLSNLQTLSYSRLDQLAPLKSFHCYNTNWNLFQLTLYHSILLLSFSMSEGLFSAANIFSSLKLVYIFSVNPHLGPLQVSLSRMVMDIMKFFFLYVLVLFAFSSGLNQLLW